MHQKPFSFKARLRSFKYAFHGLYILVRYEHNAWIHATVTFCVILAGICLSISSIEWTIITLAIGSVIASEAMNTAIEKIADFVSPDYQTLIGKAKDLAAGGVLILAICASIIGCIIFIPKIISLIF